MTADDLSAPLGQDRRSQRRRAFPISVSQAVVAALGLLALIFAAWVLIADDPFGGEPLAIAPATFLATGSGSSPEHADADPAQAALTPDALAAAPPANRTVTIIDGTSGKRQEIVIPGAANFGSVDQQPPGSTRRSGVAKITPDSRAPSSSTSAR
jgi:hypothetical protein